MSWRPTADRALLRLDQPEEKVSPGGVVLPGQAVEREKVRRGTVEAVGAGVRDLEAGQRVIVSGFAGSSVPGDEQLRLIREDDVLVVEASIEFPRLDQYDLDYIDGYLKRPNVVPPGAGVDGSGFVMADIVELAGYSVESPSGYSELDIDIYGRLRDGRWFSFNAWCDTTGWDCQSGGDASVAATRADIECFGLTDGQRRLFGIGELR